MNTIGTLGEMHTADYLVTVISEQIKYVQEEFGVRVTSNVTDNAANMNLMRKQVKLGCPFLHTYGCHAHIANLLFKDSWWKGGLRMGFDPILVDVACSIVEAVSSSAGLERYFSTMGLTYGRLRSSLGVEKAGKLSFLFRQLIR